MMRVILPRPGRYGRDSDHAVADIADAGRQKANPPGDILIDLAGKFTPVRQHVAAEQVDFHALERRRSSAAGDWILLRKRHFRHPTARP